MITKLAIGLMLATVACSPKPPVTPATTNDLGADQNQATVNPAEKYGLSETQRKQVCLELFALRQEASQSANEKYPLSVRGEKFNGIFMQKRNRKRAEFQRSLLEKSAPLLARKYNLTPAQLAEIEIEDVEKDWIRYPPAPREYR